MVIFDKSRYGPPEDGNHKHEREGRRGLEDRVHRSTEGGIEETSLESERVLGTVG